MRTIKQYIANKLTWQLVLFAFIYLAACGQEAGCGSGVSAPPPPQINISYIIQNNGMAKIYFTPSEKVIVNSIALNENYGGVIDEIIYGYPYITADAGKAHFINIYDTRNIHNEWSFTVTGTSKSTGYPFSVNCALFVSGGY